MLIADDAQVPVVKIKTAPAAAVQLTIKQQQQQHELQLKQQLQQQPQLRQQSQRQDMLQILHCQQQQLPAQLRQQLLQHQAQQERVERPTSAPQLKGTRVAFGHKADWDLSTGKVRADGLLDGQASGKPVRLNGQTLALLGSTDWGHLRTEVPVNRHVSLEHACSFANHSQGSQPIGKTAERQRTPLKGRPGSPTVKQPTVDSASPQLASPAKIAESGKLVQQCSSSLQLPRTLEGTAPLGSAASSPRCLSPNSYLARSSKSQTLANSAAVGGNPSSALRRSTSPMSRSARAKTLASSNPGGWRSSSPLSRLSMGQSAIPGTARARGRTSSSWKAAQEQVQKLREAEPLNFMQILRTRSLSPQAQDLKCKSAAAARPMWQQYDRHVTPPRAASRAAPIRRAFQGIARTASGLREEQGRAFQHESAEAAPSGLDHVPNQAPPVSAKPAKKRKSLDSRHATNAQSSPVKAWSPAGKALARVTSESPQSSGRTVLQPYPSSTSHQLQSASGDLGLGVSIGQSRPIRAGQEARAALLTKQAAWQATRSTSLPPVLSQITALLCCHAESILSPPARTATELALAADPQLGQKAAGPAVASVRQLQPLVLDYQATAPAAEAGDAHEKALHSCDSDYSIDAHTEAADAEASAAFPAKIAVPTLKPSLSSAGFKSGLRVSFARQIQTDIAAQAQHAQHDSGCNGGNYFLDEGYFQEAGTSRFPAATEEVNVLRTEEEWEAEDGIRAPAGHSMCDSG